MMVAVRSAAPAASARPRRLRWLLLLLVLTALAAGLRLQASPWLREARLRRLSLPELVRVAAAQPGDPLAQYYLGAALERRGRKREAEAAYGASLDRSPRQSRARARLAALYAGRGQETAAAALLQQGVEVDPTTLELHLALAQLYEGRGDFRRAAYEWQVSTLLSPRNAEAWYRLGRAWMALNDESRALEPHRAAARLDPLSAGYHKGAAMALRLAGRYDEAEAHCRHALFLLPEDPDAHFERMKVLRERDGSTPEVEACARRAAALRPDEPVFGYHLAGVLRERGRKAPAAAEYRAVLRRLPSHRPPPTLAAWSEWSLWLSYLEGSHMGLARLLPQLGADAEAARHLSEYRRLSDFHVRAGQLIGRLGNRPADRGLRAELARLTARAGYPELAAEAAAAGRTPPPEARPADRR